MTGPFQQFQDVFFLSEGGEMRRTPLRRLEDLKRSPAGGRSNNRSSHRSSSTKLSPKPRTRPNRPRPHSLPRARPSPLLLPRVHLTSRGSLRVAGNRRGGGERRWVTASHLSDTHTSFYFTILNNGFSIFLKCNLFLWWKADFFCNITPVFSVTWCFRNLSNTMICSLKHFLSMLTTVMMLNIFVETDLLYHLYICLHCDFWLI